MPEFAYAPSDDRVGTRDDEGAITRMPEKDFTGGPLHRVENQTLVRLDHHHFVVAQAGQLREGMTFKLLPEPEEDEEPTEDEESSEEGDTPDGE